MIRILQNEGINNVNSVLQCIKDVFGVELTANDLEGYMSDITSSKKFFLSSPEESRKTSWGFRSRKKPINNSSQNAVPPPPPQSKRVSQIAKIIRSIKTPQAVRKPELPIGGEAKKYGAPPPPYIRPSQPDHFLCVYGGPPRPDILRPQLSHSSDYNTESSDDSNDFFIEVNKSNTTSPSSKIESQDSGTWDSTDK